MKAVILAGGYGTRLSEATHLIPKPMVEIGGKPIIWHIMKYYSFWGINDFVICCGYKQYVIKEYFANYFQHNSDMTVDLATNKVEIHCNHSEKWKVTMIDTGLATMTGGRIKRIQPYIGNERFLLTYGDGLTDLNFQEELAFHEKNGAAITMLAYKPTGKFGAIRLGKGSDQILQVQEKPDGDGNWINAGYFICEPEVFDYIPPHDDTVSFERKPLERLAKDRKLYAFKHSGFWKPMDTMRDNDELNQMWNGGHAPWKLWEE